MNAKEKINWGILSTGGIAHRMAKAILMLDNANLVAVASRYSEKAQEFAQEYKIPKYFGSYQDLVKDDEIDIVYIATPNTCHYENMMLCLEYGKNIVCEKPFTLDYSQAKEVIDLARKNKLFVMEAHKSFYLTGIKKIKELIAEGAIGEVISFKADFCIKPEYNPQHRMFNLALGGGALLDVGVYPISLAVDLFGAPVEIHSNTTLCDTGADVFNSILLKHKNNQSSLINCGFNAAAPREALILGTDGYMKIHEPFHQAPKFTIKKGKNNPVEFETPVIGNGLNQEAYQASVYVKEGKLQSEEFSLDKTLEVLKIIDNIREKNNIVFK